MHDGTGLQIDDGNHFHEGGPLRIFVCEFLTGGGLAGRPAPAALCREGDIMLRALAADLAEIRGIDVVVARDARFGDPDLDVELHWIDPARDPWPAWRELIAQCDAAWPIAPESGGALAALTEQIATSGRVLMGSGLDAVRLTSSKQATSAHLERAGIPVVPTLALIPALTEALPPSADGWVVKPDDGAGADETWLLRTPAELARWTRARSDRTRFVVQPYVHGTASSLSLLCRRGRATLLACNRQHVSVEGRAFHYRGGVVGGAEARRAYYEPLAAGIAAAIPDLWGYVGVDLIDTDDGPRVLEVNARLTISYVGLRDALGLNSAALVVDWLEQEDALPSAPRPLREHVIRVDGHAA
jgi:predicted ATP-grasp superfamily ATP-dependent carboligase